MNKFFRVCPECGKEFDAGDRASPTAAEGAVEQIIYCHERCARKAENRRYYQAHKAEIIRKELERQRKKK